MCAMSICPLCPVFPMCPLYEENTERHKMSRLSVGVTNAPFLYFQPQSSLCYRGSLFFCQDAECCSQGQASWLLMGCLTHWWCPSPCKQWWRKGWYYHLKCNVKAVVLPLVAGRGSFLLWTQEASPSRSTSWAHDASTFYSQPTLIKLSPMHSDIPGLGCTCLSIASLDITGVSKKTIFIQRKAMLTDLVLWSISSRRY